MSASQWDLNWFGGGAPTLPWGDQTAAAAGQIGAGLGGAPPTPTNPANTIAQGVQGGGTSWATTQDAPPVTRLGVGTAPAAAAAPASWAGLGLGDLESANAYSTVNINGQQIKIPGYYEPGKDRSIFQNGTTAESAMGRLTRRLSDAGRAGENPGDPNVIYREMARIRDDAGANGAQTGFVHLDRFVRGANGTADRGWVGPTGQANTPYQAQSAPPTQATPQTASPATGGGIGGTSVSGTNPIINGGGGISSGMVTGGTGAAQGGGAGGGNGNINVGGAYNLKNPESVIRNFMSQHGVDPNINSGFGQFVQKLMGSIVPVLFQNMTGSNGQMALDQIGNPMDTLNGIFAGNGNLGANLSNFAGNALGQVQGNKAMQNLAPDVMQRMLGDLSALQNFGNNPYLAQANQNALDNRFSNYGDQTYRAAHGGTPQNGSLWDFIAGQGGLSGGR
jgi:hypothetical protein